MKRTVAFLMIILAIGGCNHKTRLNVFFENNSDLRKSVIIETYINSKLVDKRQVSKGDRNINWESLKFDLSNTKDSTEFMFKVVGTDHVTQCKFLTKEITSKTWLHVNLNEILFKKGDVISGKTLNKDTLMRSDFYCELVESPR